MTYLLEVQKPGLTAFSAVFLTSIVTDFNSNSDPFEKSDFHEVFGRRQNIYERLHNSGLTGHYQ